MSFEETVRSALRWHGSFTADNAKYKHIIGQKTYNKNYLESEDSSVKQIMEAYRKEMAKLLG